MNVATLRPLPVSKRAAGFGPRGCPPSRRWDRPFVWCAVLAPLAGAATLAPAGESPFAARVVDYSPAPGQFVNHAQFNDPARALGPPHGAGLVDADNTSVVTLGGFGGSITLAFDHTVEDHPLNPFGLDAIVFGNAFWFGGDPDERWAECAVIEISLDVNGNGLADDPWYLIPGSHIQDPAAQWSTRTWDDVTADSTHPPAGASWIPPGATGVWTTSAYQLPAAIFAQVTVLNPAWGTGREGVFGYGDCSPTLLLGDLDGDNGVDDPTISPEAFYTVPDDPFTVGITSGSGGGDAFDIAWAVDATTGESANLPGFDFIRLSNGVDAVLGPFGEKSPEIDAVADVAPDSFGDADEDEDIDLVDVSWVQRCFLEGTTGGDACARLDRQPDGNVDGVDVEAFVPRLTGPR